jgi:hypothetical protein
MFALSFFVNWHLKVSFHICMTIEFHICMTIEVEVATRLKRQICSSSRVYSAFSFLFCSDVSFF